MGITVFCAGAVRGAMTRLASGFESETGQRLEFEFGAVGSLKSRLAAGDHADVLVLSRPALEELYQKEHLVEGSIRVLGRVGVGIAVREGRPAPPLATAADLSKALLAAASLAYGDPAHGDSSGLHFDAVLDRLGIKEQLKQKAMLAASGLVVAELVRLGRAELGATQASVIAACPGIVMAGMLPPELQHVTTYAFAISSRAASSEVAHRFYSYLQAPSARVVLEDAGFKSTDQGRSDE